MHRQYLNTRSQRLAFQAFAWPTKFNGMSLINRAPTGLTGQQNANQCPARSHYLQG